MVVVDTGNLTDASQVLRDYYRLIYFSLDSYSCMLRSIGSQCTNFFFIFSSTSG